GPTCHQDDVGLQADQLLRERSHPIEAIAIPPKVHPHVAALGPAHARKRLSERREIRLRLVFVEPHKHADAPHAVALRRACRRRPCRRTPEPHDELPPSHSITSSATASRLGGTVMPSALAIFMLITSSNLVGCITGKSEGLSPLRMRPT